MGEQVRLFELMISAALIGAAPIDDVAAQEAPPGRDEVLRTVLAALDGFLPDARAIRDMRACSPTHIKRNKDGSIKGYTISLQLNSPTAEGGMSGRRLYYVIVRNGRGRVTEGDFQPARSGAEPSGIGGLLGDKASRDIEGCSRVTPEEMSAVFSRIDSE